MSAPDKAALIAERAARYEALRSAGQDATPAALPAPTAIGSAPIPDEAVIHREEIPGGAYWTTALRRGEALRLMTPGGDAAVSVAAWRQDETTERINPADTVKVQWSAAIRKGRVILSDMGRIVFSVIEDSSGAHDALAGGSTAGSNAERFGSGRLRNTRDNFVAAVGKLGLDRRDIPPCVTFFAPVSVGSDGKLGWDGSRRRAGDFVDLRAEMDLLVAVSNCPHPVDPVASYAPGPIEAVRFRAPAPGPDDPCRTGSPEAARAFAATERLYA